MALPEPPDTGRPKLLYVVTEDWFFCSHRLPMARAARDAGFEVHLATHIAEHEAAIRAEGITLHPQPAWRRSLNPAPAFATIGHLTELYRRLRPDIVHHVSMMPVLFGSAAAQRAGVASVVNSLTGLGYVFVSDDAKARLIRPAVKAALSWLLTRPNTVTVVQNDDDRQELLDIGLADTDHIALIRGSGVDTDHFALLPDPPTEPFTIGYAGRMLADKGVPVLVEAVARLTAAGKAVRLILAGKPDPKNPSSLAPAQLAEWGRHPAIDYRGELPDIRDLWAASHVAVLPSRREGLPKSLMEAAACGRALIATDVPGCREVARQGHNALLVPPDDAAALADAIARLAEDPPLRLELAARSRTVVDGELCSRRVSADIAALYAARLPARRG